MRSIRVRFPRPRPRKSVEQAPVSAEPLDVVQRDDGMFAIGWHDDAAGPFESRTLALAVAAGQARAGRTPRTLQTLQHPQTPNRAGQ